MPPGHNLSKIPWLLVTVEEYTTQPDGTRWALCTDQFRHQQTIPLSPIPGGGVLPQVGEVWSIERRGSEQWTFAARWVTNPPPIMVDTTGDAMPSLVAALTKLGLVTDQTGGTASSPSHAHYQGTPPTSPAVGDLWFDSANDNSISYWNGSAWVPLPIGTGGLGNDVPLVPDDGVAPSAPVGLVLTPGIRTLELKWTANTEPDMVNGYGSYQVQWCTDGTFTSTASMNTGATLALVSGLVSTLSYWLRVRAIDAHNNASPWSAVLSGSPAQVQNSDVASGAIATDQLADFILTAEKFNDGRHHIY